MTARSDINLGRGAAYTISSSGQYSNINLGRNAVLTVDTDATIYVTNMFHFDRDSQLRITNDVDVKIYVDTTLTLDQGSRMNNLSEDPTKFGVYGTASFTNTVDIDQGSNFYGTIHTPNGSIQIDQNTIIYGALLASSINLDRRATIHFDEALLNAGGSSGSGYSVAYWQEK